MTDWNTLWWDACRRRRVRERRKIADLESNALPPASKTPSNPLGRHRQSPRCCLRSVPNTSCWRSVRRQALAFRWNTGPARSWCCGDGEDVRRNAAHSERSRPGALQRKRRDHYDFGRDEDRRLHGQHLGRLAGSDLIKGDATHYCEVAPARMTMALSSEPEATSVARKPRGQQR